jgi:hypothetical protein
MGQISTQIAYLKVLLTLGDPILFKSAPGHSSLPGLLERTSCARVSSFTKDAGRIWRERLADAMVEVLDTRSTRMSPDQSGNREIWPSNIVQFLQNFSDHTFFFFIA